MLDPAHRSPVCYHLSNAQRKELLLRNTELQIALPAPPHAVDDPADWARSVLPQEFRPLVSDATETEVSVNLLTVGTGLARLLGAITDYDRDRPQWLVSIAAVVATLTPTQRRHRSRKIQWPMGLRFFETEIQ